MMRTTDADGEGRKTLLRQSGDRTCVTMSGLPWRRGQTPEAPSSEAGGDPKASADVSVFPTQATYESLRRESGCSRRDIMRAWDATADRAFTTLEARAQACLARLKSGIGPVPEAGPAGMERIRDARPQAPSPQTAANVIDLEAQIDQRRAGPSHASTPAATVIDLTAEVRPSDAGPSRSPASTATAKDAPSRMDEDAALASITSLFPTILPSFATETLRKWEWHVLSVEDRLQRAVDHIFGLKEAYPKVQSVEPQTIGKRKRSQEEDEAAARREEEDRYLKPYEDRDTHYRDACLRVLLEDFPIMPKPLVDKVAKRHHFFYAPSYLSLQGELKQGRFKPLRNARKARDRASQTSLPVPLHAEINWLIAYRARLQAAEDAKAAIQLADAADEAAGLLITCGCCFGDVVFRKMVQCEDAHLFCMECAKAHCETLIGMRRIDLRCMDESGCTASFVDVELKRFLKPGTIELLDRLRQEKAIDDAGLEGLEKCAFCDFACIIEDPNERLFRCGNDECGKILCRKCKDLDHLPKTCEEHKKEKAEQSLHRVEEAMTAALIRNCPKCKQPFVKTDGCNKMNCTHCGQLSCFICRKSISGYQHFEDAPRYTTNRRVEPGAKCPLFDDTVTRIHREVEAARATAGAEVLRTNTSIAQADLDRLRAPAPADRPPPPPPPVPQGHNFQYNAAAPRPAVAPRPQIRGLPPQGHPGAPGAANAQIAYQNAIALGNPNLDPAYAAQVQRDMANLRAHHRNLYLQAHRGRGNGR